MIIDKNSLPASVVKPSIRIRIRLFIYCQISFTMNISPPVAIISDTI